MKKLGFGMMRLPLPDPQRQGQVDMEQVCRMVDAFLERGFTYFDTAYMYHDYNSERIVRQALVERHPRDSFTLATKLPTMQLKRPEDQERIFQEQLEKCGVTYFDYYLLHNLGISHYEIARQMGSFDFVREKKAAGLVRQIGFSYHDNATLLDEILAAHPEIDFVQLQLNYIDWDSESVQSRKCYEVAVAHGKPVVVMEPVKGGTLAKAPAEAEALLRAAHPDWSVPSWAVRFAASLDHVMVVLSGMSNMEQLLDNTAALDPFQPLTAAELQVVAQVVEIIRRTVAVPCTACRYCVEGCPQHIAIPAYFDLYNTQKQLGGAAQRAYYENFNRSNGKASDCVACGQCREACPQHIDIIKWLKEVAATFEA